MPERYLAQTGSGQALRVAQGRAREHPPLITKAPAILRAHLCPRGIDTLFAVWAPSQGGALVINDIEAVGLDPISHPASSIDFALCFVEGEGSQPPTLEDHANLSGRLPDNSSECKSHDGLHSSREA